MSEEKKGVRIGKEGNKREERRGSTENIEEMWKRKREVLKKEGG